MRIEGEWLVEEDGIPRPAIRVRVPGANGQAQAEWFLVDTLADRTVFSAGLLSLLFLPSQPKESCRKMGGSEGKSLFVPPGSSPLTHPSFGGEGLQLAGIGGRSAYVLVTATLELFYGRGQAARVHGQFAAFTDPQATDLSILGRDVLNNFDVIVSRPRNEVLLLAPNHIYQVVGA